MNDAIIVSAARTPIGSLLGSFKDFPAPDLGAAAIRASLERAGLEPSRIEEVIMGNVLGAGVGQAPARQAALKANIPPTVSAVTVNKVCGSGLQAVMFAAQAIRVGDAHAIVAGGMENMTRAPHLLFNLRAGQKLGDSKLIDSMVFDGLTCAFEGCHMGNHAEHIATKFGVSREDQDRFAAQSQQRAAKAISDGVFQEEITPITIPSRKGDTIVDTDEGPRPETTAEALARLRPVFDNEGTVTAGNASTISDGAAAVVLLDANSAANVNSSMKAKIVSYATSGTEPKDLFIAPVYAIQSALKKADLQPGDVELYEINEAFASQMVACINELKLDESQVNIYGGGISLGHPIGASGARTLVTLLHALKRNNMKRGVVSLCLGGGNAVAMVIEMI